MMNNCDLIRDLMPLYADSQASEASRRCIEEHTAQCPACRKMLKEMCAPLEPEPEDRTEQIMEMLYKKQRRKTLRTITAIVLSVIIAVWGFLELRYSGELIYASSTNEEKILREMPELALTEDELDLAQTILQIPGIWEAMESGQDSTILNLKEITPYFDSILPENGQLTEVFILGSHVYITIIEEYRYTCLVYSDIDMTGHIDQILKTMATYSHGILDADGFLGEADAVYDLIYTVGGIPRYQKYKTRHMWFSFLDW